MPRFCHCGAYVERGKHCPDCAPKRVEQKRGQRTELSPRERGYDGKWTKLSVAYRVAHPLCELCKADGIVEPATSVHHKEPIRTAPERRLDWTNLQALCEPCHRRADALNEAHPPTA